MPRRRRPQEHDNHERWMVSYADFITLLFGFFVVMYSISQVNEHKYRELSTTLVEAFNPARAARLSIEDIPASPFEPPAAVPEVLGSRDLGDLQGLVDALHQRFGDLMDQELLSVYANEHWLQIELRDSILFGSGSAAPSERAINIFADLADILKAVDNPVQVEGFTDNVPIRTAQFPSNWELSAARASAVVKLLADNAIAPERLAAVGYGEYQPVASNATAEGRAQNRRVALMVARQKIERPRTALDPEGADDAGQEGSVEPAPTPSEVLGPGGDAVIAPVPLEGGGLLFSSDPDLPRIRPPAAGESGDNGERDQAGD
ncbi:flagellar motor protein MotD [Marinimicrobium alkaliphilum]|uniref:flagellar motor protein MotD n=1 Tax=Marinimicrobium alkaliphilum TaxID=2202654 RepID=UPI000DB99D30|nr:flagellar motor protein MotD [Marinimicrobium alkaliphilum]